MRKIRCLYESKARLLQSAVAAFTGLLSGLLIYLLVHSVLFGLAQVRLVSPALKLSIFLEGWIFSALLLYRASTTLTEIIAKAFLLGSVEWLAVALAGVFLFAGRPYVGAVMSLVCLLGFAITQIWYVQQAKCKKIEEATRYPLVSKPPT